MGLPSKLKPAKAMLAAAIGFGDARGGGEASPCQMGPVPTALSTFLNTFGS